MKAISAAWAGRGSVRAWYVGRQAGRVLLGEARRDSGSAWITCATVHSTRSISVVTLPGRPRATSSANWSLPRACAARRRSWIEAADAGRDGREELQRDTVGELAVDGLPQGQALGQGAGLPAARVHLGDEVVDQAQGGGAAGVGLAHDRGDPSGHDGQKRARLAARCGLKPLRSTARRGSSSTPAMACPAPGSIALRMPRSKLAALGMAQRRGDVDVEPLAGDRQPRAGSRA